MTTLLENRDPKMFCIMTQKKGYPRNGIWHLTNQYKKLHTQKMIIAKYKLYKKGEQNLRTTTLSYGKQEAISLVAGRIVEQSEHHRTATGISEPKRNGATNALAIAKR